MNDPHADVAGRGAGAERDPCLQIRDAIDDPAAKLRIGRPSIANPSFRAREALSASPGRGLVLGRVARTPRRAKVKAHEPA